KSTVEIFLCCFRSSLSDQALPANFPERMMNRTVKIAILMSEIVYRCSTSIYLRAMGMEKKDINDANKVPWSTLSKRRLICFTLKSRLNEPQNTSKTTMVNGASWV